MKNGKSDNEKHIEGEQNNSLQTIFTFTLFLQCMNPNIKQFIVLL